MLISKKSKGFSLIEVIYSFTILGLILLTVFSINRATLDNYKYNKATFENINLVNNLKVYIQNNISYEQLSYIYENNLKYVKGKNFTIGYVQNKNLNEVFISSEPKEYPYIVCIIEKNEIYNIKLVVLDENMNSIEDSAFRCEFYKGEY